MENIEKYNLEFKREISKTFLKSVSAFANYNDGKILFGVEDNGEIAGILNAVDEKTKIENMINDSISPVPNYIIDVIQENNRQIIVLKVKKGENPPYYYQGKSYKRNDTSTIEVDKFELKRLVLSGMNKNFEELQSKNKRLNENSFQTLEKELQNKVGIEKLDFDILKTLNLYNKEKYFNIAGELISDENEIEFSGIDIVKFGESINEILYRKIIEKKSLITQYNEAVEIFNQYYTYEKIEGFEREKVELIPEKSFREAVANALVHRVWDINSNTRIAMYRDRIEIISPGGLPDGLDEEEYLRMNISVLRNPIIAGVFFRLNIIEKFGTGIARIKAEYGKSLSKPKFSITKNSISIILPIFKTELDNLEKVELEIIRLLNENEKMSRSEIEKLLNITKSKTIRNLNGLIERDLIEIERNGRKIFYKLK